MAIFSENYFNENFHIPHSYKLKGKYLLPFNGKSDHIRKENSDKIQMAISLTEKNWDKILDFTAKKYFEKFLKSKDEAFDLYKTFKDVKNDLILSTVFYKKYDSDRVHPCGQICLRFNLKSNPRVYLNTVPLVNYDKNKNLQLKMSG